MSAKLINNSGTFGCIYHPGIPCNPNEIVGPEYATKIHSNTNQSIVLNEIAISNKIKENIPDYADYFSPVLDACKVNLANVDAGKCKFIKNKTPVQFVSTKMKFIKGQSLLKHVKQLTNMKAYKEVVTLYDKICLAVEKLSEIHVVHFDLKSDNVIVTKSGTPIIIDFGISMDMDNVIASIDKGSVSKKASVSNLSLSNSNVSKSNINISMINPSVSRKSESSLSAFPQLLDYSFYTYNTDYSSWCVEIVLISFIVQKQKPREMITSTQIMNIFDEVMRKNKFANKNYLKDAVILYRANFKLNIADKFNNVENVKLLSHLITKYRKWDIYSATILFIKMLEQIKQFPSDADREIIIHNLGFME
jgi:serine/threonine protein kinase